MPIYENEAGYKFHYASYGNDWGVVDGLSDEDNFCGFGENASPINVMDPIGSYGWAYGFPLPKFEDAVEINYSNILNPTQVKFDYSALNVTLEDNIGNYFDSKYARDFYNASTTRFYPTHF